MTQTPKAPEIPARFTDPLPVLIVGSVAWLIATVVVWASGNRFDDALPTCLAGLGVSVLAGAIFLIQRRSFRRGSKGAQSGLS